jgi:DNA-cytosine methyltransferase
MKNRPFYHASLFTGIGGFDLAASWVGWQNVFQCEIDPFCQNVLKYQFPQCDLFSDIRTSNFNKYHGKIDIISGGFPCQPFSLAGKRKGTNDDRYLWAEMLRVIREVQPRWVVAENVCGLLSMQSGMVFERVCADLENAGYAVQPFVIPACAVGAPHRRDRVWIVARSTFGYAHSDIGGTLGKIRNGESLIACGNSEVATDANGVYAAGQGYGQTECTNGADNSGRDVADNGTAVRFGDKPRLRIRKNTSIFAV